jgi:hypothetical protein
MNGADILIAIARILTTEPSDRRLPGAPTYASDPDLNTGGRARLPRQHLRVGGRHLERRRPRRSALRVRALPSLRPPLRPDRAGARRPPRGRGLRPGLVGARGAGRRHAHRHARSGGPAGRAAASHAWRLREAERQRADAIIAEQRYRGVGADERGRGARWRRGIWEGIIEDITGQRRTDEAGRRPETCAPSPHWPTRRCTRSTTCRLELIRRRLDPAQHPRLDQALEASKRIADIIAHMGRIMRMETHADSAVSPALDLHQSSAPPEL